MPISALILTRNEEVNLPGCLASLGWCDDVVVLDSYSSDRTEEIAKGGGARFFQREFDDYAAQRNHGIREIEYRHPWLLMVDADEVVPTTLVDEMVKAVRGCEEGVSLFRLRRKDFFFGKWLKHSSGYPTWFGRLLRLGDVWVEREINEEYHTEGEIRELVGHLHHYPFNKGFASWVEKHNRYSTMEATHMVQQRVRINLLDLVSIDPVRRRKTLKDLVYSLPGRPVVVFFGFYVAKGGFLEGRAGLIFCVLRAFYEFMISCKIRELRQRAQGLPL